MAEEKLMTLRDMAGTEVIPTPLPLIITHKRLRAEAVKICNILSQRKGKLVFGEIKLWWDCRDLANNDAMIRKNLLKDFIMWQNNLTEEDLA